MSEQWIGRLIGQRYQVTSWIGQSAVGEVFEAVDTKHSNEKVALKVLSHPAILRPDQWGYLQRRFQEEARINLKLNGHPHIVEIKGCNAEGETPYLVMERLGVPPLAGSYLSTVLKQEGSLPLDRFFHLALQICDGLSYAHSFEGEVDGIPIHGIVHRDIKPDTIFVIQDPEQGEIVKITDFGIAKLLSDLSYNLGTQVFGFVGTLSHASPEQMRGDGLDPRSDIYSLGIVFYECLTGQLPLQPETDSFAGWYEAHLHLAPRSFASAGITHLPSALEKLILSCLAKDPVDRPHSIQTLVNQMRDILRPPISFNSRATEILPRQYLPQAPEKEKKSPSTERPRFDRKSSTPQLALIGKGRYQVIRSLGAGGMGEVYLALDTLLNKQVAVKVMSTSSSVDKQSLLKRFQREIAISAKLTSPNVVQITDFGTTEEEGGKPFYVMEYLQGQTLGQLLANKGKLHWSQCLRIAIQVCSGLSEAHDQGVAHRDLKPDNIFLVPSTLGELVKILDFGIAKIVDDSEDGTKLTRLTVEGTFIGTLRYASPEQCGFYRVSVDQRTDIYSLGVILYEMLTGSNPFNIQIESPKSRNLQWLDAHLRTEPIPLLNQPGGADLPPELEPIVMRCLNKNPEDRFSSIRELEQALQAIRKKDSTGIIPLPQTPTLGGQPPTVYIPLEPTEKNAPPRAPRGEPPLGGSYPQKSRKSFWFAVPPLLLICVLAAGLRFTWVKASPEKRILLQWCMGQTGSNPKDQGTIEAIVVAANLQCRSLLFASDPKITDLDLFNQDPPIESLTPLSSLTSLKTLNLADNQVSDLTPLQPLTSLTTLNLTNNRIRDLSPLRTLTALTTLNVGNWREDPDTTLEGCPPITESNHIEDISPLASLRQLKELDLRCNPVKTLEPLAHLENLETLNLRNNQITVIPPLPRLRHLKILDLGNTLPPGPHNNRIVQVDALASLPQLEDLDLSNNVIEYAAPLASLTTLQRLVLIGNPLIDGCPFPKNPEKCEIGI
jgi:serine/threonine protein kinase